MPLPLDSSIFPAHEKDMSGCVLQLSFLCRVCMDAEVMCKADDRSENLLILYFLFILYILILVPQIGSNH